MERKSFMVHEETIKERIDRRFERLEMTIDACSSLDVVDSIFYLGEDGEQFTDEQSDKLKSLYGLFHEQCGCKKKEDKFMTRPPKKGMLEGIISKLKQ